MNPENLTIPDWVNWIAQDAYDAVDWHNSLTKVD